MTLMATEKPPRIHLEARHPITGRRHLWFEHEGVVFRLSSDRPGSRTWHIEPERDHLEGGREVIDFIRSSAYWSAAAIGLDNARAKLAAFIASSEFEALREAYAALPVQLRYRTR